MTGNTTGLEKNELRCDLPHGNPGLRIMYQSTNRRLMTGDTKGFQKKVTFGEALFMGQAPDNGLFMPTELPRFSRKEISSLKGKTYHEAAFAVLKAFLRREIGDEELRDIARDAYDFDVPLERLSRYVYILRLDRGPTASFKDFAARLMARLMQKLKPAKEKIRILVATSGDTGSAIGEAYRGMDGFKVYILYPESEISLIQKRQMDAIGENVRTLAVDGKFDDCQRLVKAAFGDPDLAKMNLSSANSINIGRILPQIVYYFYAYANIIEKWRPVIYSIPSGNFGNSLGCELARRMGLPVEKIIIATNENDEFPKYLKCGRYEKIEPSKKCLSNAMNVGNPSNLARYFDLYGGILDKEGTVHKSADLEDMRKNLYSEAISDRETIDTIKSVYKRYGVLIEPHGAAGVAALWKYFKGNERRLTVCLETAHPAKFPDVIKKELNLSPAIPDSLKRMDKRHGQAERMSNDYKKFKNYLLKEE